MIAHKREREANRHGAAVCSSDEIVHRLIAEDAEVRAVLEERFGTTDRAVIATRSHIDPNRNTAILAFTLGPAA